MRVPDKDIGDSRKSYKELSHKDVQCIVESVHRGWGYLGKRRGFEKSISVVVWVSTNQSRGRDSFKGVEL